MRRHFANAKRQGRLSAYCEGYSNMRVASLCSDLPGTLAPLLLRLASRRTRNAIDSLVKKNAAAAGSKSLAASDVQRAGVGGLIEQNRDRRPPLRSKRSSVHRDVSAICALPTPRRESRFFTRRFRGERRAGTADR